MDPHHNKKKTRTRNRPRNKCNRGDEQQQGNERAHVPLLSGASPDPNPATSHPHPHSPPAASQAMGKDSAIYLIQQLLRKKLLANKKPTAPASVKVEAPPRVRTTPVEQHIAKNLDNRAQVNELLKCMGSKLQKGAHELPTDVLLSKLGNMLSKEPLSDAESSDEEAEYVEYIYKPRPYFMASLCNHCKMDLCAKPPLPCKDCGLVYYCSSVHMREDQLHKQLCYGLCQLVQRNGHDIFYKSGDFSAEQFRSYRIVCIRQLEQLINRNLTATEQEVLLFPLICNEFKCREHRLKRLARCTRCGEVAYCQDKPQHLNASHAAWCPIYRLFKTFVMLQAKFGRIEPPLPDEVLRELPSSCSDSRQIMQKLNFSVPDQCEFAALTQISTGPLTAFYALKLCDRLQAEKLTIHLIGAEMEFEVDVFQKWEIFLLHILPALKTLNIVFIGPELNAPKNSFDQLSKIKCCRLCRKAQRTVQYYFENRLYHDYCASQSFQSPDLVCFFNPGLYRATGFALQDTWPETIRATLNLNCPVVVTSYTKYEAPLDMSHFLNQSNRHINVVLPPTTNPFGSKKPERNFISDDDAPFMFKNYQCFVVE